MSRLARTRNNVDKSREVASEIPVQGTGNVVTPKNKSIRVAPEIVSALFPFQLLTNADEVKREVKEQQGKQHLESDHRRNFL